jgi:hypothetical protein
LFFSVLVDFALALALAFGVEDFSSFASLLAAPNEDLPVVPNEDFFARPPELTPRKVIRI